MVHEWAKTRCLEATRAQMNNSRRWAALQRVALHSAQIEIWCPGHSEGVAPHWLRCDRFYKQLFTVLIQYMYQVPLGAQSSFRISVEVVGGSQ